MWFYLYLVLLGAFSKEEHKFHGVGSPLGEYFEKKKKRQPAKPRMSLFEDRLLSHSDTGFRIYVKNGLDWYQGPALKRFLSLSSGSPKVNKEFWCECCILLFWI